MKKGILHPDFWDRPAFGEAHFGGPDLPARRLRDLLEAHVAAVPKGGRIDWVTYYFRDRRLGMALLEAQDRGVSVQVTLEGRPRTARANDRVRALLEGGGGLGAGVRNIRMWPFPTPPGKLRHPHLHEKLYCFSHPENVALLGSFNPSGDEPEEDPAMVEEIRDQDRGHNLLVEVRDQNLVEGLRAHAQWLHGARFPGLLGVLASPNRRLFSGATEIHFLPRFGRHPLLARLDELGPGARVRIAGSHVKGAGIVRALTRLAQHTRHVYLLAEHTERRVPSRVERCLRDAGIMFQRTGDHSGLPMHNKFVLAEEGERRWTAFGSFNWTTRSFWINREILVISSDPGLYDAFDRRWQTMWGPGESEERSGGLGAPPPAVLGPASPTLVAPTFPSESP